MCSNGRPYTTVQWVEAAVAVVGSLLGSRVAARVSPRTLSITFIAMLVAVSAYMAAASIPLLVA